MKRHSSIAPKLAIKKSLALLQRARRVIPGCSQTFSKCYTQFTLGASPVFVERGRGSHVWDLDENEFIDYPMALGAIILGHAFAPVDHAVKTQMKKGMSYSLPHRLEVELAELLCDIIPCAEMVRFAKNGSDATAGAVRAARAYTGRERIACSGYHGWQDWFIGTTTRNKGVPKSTCELTHPFPYNDLTALNELFQKYPNEIAAVVLEPVGIVPPQPGFLEGVRDLAHKNGAVLIFDEIVTGFRFALGGAQSYFKVTPDLACFGKAMGNGYPISCVVGKKDLMSIFDEIFFSFTFGGEALSLAASLETIRFMKEKKALKGIWSQGESLIKGEQDIIREAGLSSLLSVEGYAPRSLIMCQEKNGVPALTLKTLLQQEMLRRGILFSGNQNICYSHSSADINRTLDAFHDSCGVVAKAVQENRVETSLLGETVQAVFRKA